MTRFHVFLCAALVCLLSYFAPATTRAQETESSEDDKPAVGVPPADGMLSNPDDPPNQLPLIRERKAEKDAVFPVSPLQNAHDDTNESNAALKEKTGLELGMNSNTLFQSEGRPRGPEGLAGASIGDCLRQQTEQHG